MKRLCVVITIFVFMTAASCATLEEHKGGTYRSNTPIFLPKDAQKGTYKVLYIVQTAYSKDTREASFVVD